MYSIIEKNRMIERVHHLIKRRATGTPEELAKRLNLSKATVFRIVDTMKEMGAPITYNSILCHYEYSKNVDYVFGFRIINELSDYDKTKITGGFYFNYLSPVSINESVSTYTYGLFNKNNV